MTRNLSLRNRKNSLAHRQASSLANGKRNGDRVEWTDAEIETLKRLAFDHGMTHQQIVASGKLAGRTPTAIYGKIHGLRTLAHARSLHDAVGIALLERDKRARASQHQSLTGAIFGDPPPGYSALDRRRE